LADLADLADLGDLGDLAGLAGLVDLMDLGDLMGLADSVDLVDLADLVDSVDSAGLGDWRLAGAASGVGAVHRSRRSRPQRAAWPCRQAGMRGLGRMAAAAAVGLLGLGGVAAAADANTARGPGAGRVSADTAVADAPKTGQMGGARAERTPTDPGQAGGAPVVDGAAAGAESLAIMLAASRPVETGWRWPLDAPINIARPFDLPPEPWLAGHRGVDLAAEPGATIYTPAAGVVSFNGWIVDRHVLVIRHGELASTLEPVISSLAVDDAVHAGQPVGSLVSGEAEHCPGCLHWGVRRGDTYLDPTLLVEPRPRAVLWE
jgi:hypothetical protein